MASLQWLAIWQYFPLVCTPCNTYSKLLEWCWKDWIITFLCSIYAQLVSVVVTNNLACWSRNCLSVTSLSLQQVPDICLPWSANPTRGSSTMSHWLEWRFIRNNEGWVIFYKFCQQLFLFVYVRPQTAVPCRYMETCLYMIRQACV